VGATKLDDFASGTVDRLSYCWEFAEPIEFPDCYANRDSTSDRKVITQFAVPGGNVDGASQDIGRCQAGAQEFICLWIDEPPNIFVQPSAVGIKPFLEIVQIGFCDRIGVWSNLLTQRI
jgi:hypothetical protein